MRELNLFSGKNVLSLFDGMSCGRLALDRAGVEYENYFASEIDAPAMLVAQANYPDTVQLGDVSNLGKHMLPHIHLLIGGSPCQGFSFAGRQLNFDDPRSKLFFEFVRILEETQPEYFLLENVRMKQEYLEVITRYLGVEPIMINSSSFSAQDRKRYYWTNIPVDQVPEPSPVTVEDILEHQVADKYFIEPGQQVKILENEVQRRKIAVIGTDSQANRIYRIHGKSVCLCGDAGGLGAKTGLYAMPCLTPERAEKRQNGRRFKPPQSKFYTLTAQDKHGILIDNYIRKLTPTECERLQTLTDVKKTAIFDLEKKVEEYKECTENRKIHAQNAENQCLRSQKSVGSAEQKDLSENVLSVGRCLNINLQQTEGRAVLNVHINLEDLNSLSSFLKSEKKDVSSVEKSSWFHRQRAVKDFALLTASIALILDQITPHGREALLQRGRHYIQPLSGRGVSKRSGREITQRVSDVGKDTLTIKRLMKYITSFPSQSKPTEQELITLYYSAMSAITGCILNETKIMSLSKVVFDIHHGYTFGVSDNQRYKMLGNGWTVDAIAHIFKGMNKK